MSINRPTTFESDGSLGDPLEDLASRIDELVRTYSEEEAAASNDERGEQSGEGTARVPRFR